MNSDILDIDEVIYSLKANKKLTRIFLLALLLGWIAFWWLVIKNLGVDTGLLIWIWWIPFFLWILGTLYIWRIYYQISAVIESLEYIFSWKYKSMELEDVLQKIERIWNILSNKAWFHTIIHSKNLDNYEGSLLKKQRIWWELVSKLYEILITLKHILQKSISEKSELLRLRSQWLNIRKDDPDTLKKILWLQKMRLDHQIEQFEELQKILIKI